MNDNSFLNKLKVLTTNSDMAIAVCLVMIMGVMIVPVSPFIMDVLIATSIASSMMILLMSIYAKRPLDFSTFPSLLLVTTFFRLALNVASTRNILINGGSQGSSAAGEIIRSFGDYVVGGNFAVGIILFIILVIINFIVITKGAGRVAEVAARFTLDAMPGKQMAIDADLNAGLIDEAMAKKRRAEVAAEADFYGSMDGASKFVRGDAIAGIMITFINIIGGIVVGMAQNDMSFTDATEVFTLLTVGDGLIAQIPAIVISIAAGIIATRNSEEDTLGSQIGIQIVAHPRALYISAGVLLLFGFIPNFPFMPFAIIASGLIYAGKTIDSNNAEKAQKAKLASLETKTTNAENLEELLNLEMVELEVGYGLVNVVDSEQSGELLERISQIRKQFALTSGL